MTGSYKETDYRTNIGIKVGKDEDDRIKTLERIWIARRIREQDQGLTKFEDWEYKDNGAKRGN